MGTGESRYIYRNKLDKACCQHDLVYSDLPKRIASDKVLCDRAFNIANNPKYNQRSHGCMIMTQKVIPHTYRNVYINKLDGIVNKYNNIYLISIKLKPIDVNPSGCIDFDVENNDGDPKLKVDIM